MHKQRERKHKRNPHTGNLHKGFAHAHKPGHRFCGDR